MVEKHSPIILGFVTQSAPESADRIGPNDQQGQQERLAFTTFIFELSIYRPFLILNLSCY